MGLVAGGRACRASGGVLPDQARNSGGASDRGAAQMTVFFGGFGVGLIIWATVHGISKMLWGFRAVVGGGHA